MGGNFSRPLKTAAAVLAGAALAIVCATGHARDKPRGLFNRSQLVLVAVEPYLHRLAGNIKYYPLERVQPPAGVKSIDWIKSGMKPGNW